MEWGDEDEEQICEDGEQGHERGEKEKEDGEHGYECGEQGDGGEQGEEDGHEQGARSRDMRMGSGHMNMGRREMMET